MKEDPAGSARLSAILFFVAGALFFVTAVMGGQATFYALGAVFVCLGAAMLAKARRRKE